LVIGPPSLPNRTGGTELGAKGEFNITKQARRGKMEVGGKKK